MMWRALRQQRLAAEPLCRMCRTQEERLVAATVVDHVKPHRGDERLFFDYENTQSLCEFHHNSTKQVMERGGTPKPSFRYNRKTGWPIQNGGGRGE